VPATKSAPRRADTAKIVQEAILKALDKGVAPWSSPYLGGALPRSLGTSKVYRGINVLLLQVAAGEAGYASPWWGTYKAIQGLGGQVRRGEKGTQVVFWKSTRRTETDDAGETVSKGGVFMRTYTVFNAAQANGLDPEYLTGPNATDHDPVEAAEAIVAGYVGRPAIVSVDQDLAYYQPGLDRVNIPKPENLRPGTYYPVLFHELGHSTGHAKRLAREGVVNLTSHRQGETYGFEELVAEITSAILTSEAGLPSSIDNSAAYVAGWARYVAGARTDAVVKAASQAQKAVDLILGTTFEDREAA
jgi:antirestriction protein ArdC